VIAAKMREEAEHAYYHHAIAPLLDDQVVFVGEADQATKIDLLRGADALLNPIQWPEPFGMVMIEALACGTPVIATPNGAVPEIVTPGATGWLATIADDLAAAIGRIGELDRRQCRRAAVERFSLQAMAAEHEAFYHRVLDAADHAGGGHQAGVASDLDPVCTPSR
jgi:glycosyltransferase involved in cell wall biosynthesis